METRPVDHFCYCPKIYLQCREHKLLSQYSEPVNFWTEVMFLEEELRLDLHRHFIYFQIMQ